MPRAVYVVYQKSTGAIVGAKEADDELEPLEPQEIAVDPQDQDGPQQLDPDIVIVRIVDDNDGLVTRRGSRTEYSIGRLLAKRIVDIELGEARVLLPDIDVDAIAARVGTDAIHPVTGEPTKMIPILELAKELITRKLRANTIWEQYRLDYRPLDIINDKESSQFDLVTERLTPERKARLEARLAEPGTNLKGVRYVGRLRRKTT